MKPVDTPWTNRYLTGDHLDPNCGKLPVVQTHCDDGITPIQFSFWELTEQDLKMVQEGLKSGKLIFRLGIYSSNHPMVSLELSNPDDIPNHFQQDSIKEVYSKLYPQPLQNGQEPDKPSL